MNKNNKNQSKSQIQDTKLKCLMPTLRQKKRFIKATIESKKKLDFKEVSENLVDEIITYLGCVEMGKAGIWILRDKFDYDKQEIVLKCGTKSKDKLIGVLSLVYKLGQNDVKINVTNVSGTLKGLEK